MHLFSITNIPEMRSIFLFNRVSLEISESVRRLATGERIISGKDDPAGLISRDIMRGNIHGIQAAQRNTARANEMLSTAESGLAHISQMLVGDINNRDDNGLLGLIFNSTLSPEMKERQINDILTMLDRTARGTTYNGQRLLDGSMGEVLFQLGMNVQESMQHRMVMPNMTTTGLGGTSGTLHQLRGMDWNSEVDKAQAYAIVNEAINMVAVERGTIGGVQRFVLDPNAQRLETQLERTMEAEGMISNVDMALESARLNRAEILAQSAMSAILHSRSVGQFMMGLLL
jgi:flagellin-like hook-associated protein FlgL